MLDDGKGVFKLGENDVVEGEELQLSELEQLLKADVG